LVGNKFTLKRGAKDEAEKPFWISFSDLMTALMVLFLLVMSVELLQVITPPTDPRDEEINQLLLQIEASAKVFPGVTVNRERNVIDFGPQALFDTNKHQLTPHQAEQLRKFVPKVLEVSESRLGKKWFKEVIVEGYTDKTGTYLFNLNLSLQRSQRVLCILLGPAPVNEFPLTPEQQNQVRDLFVVGGYSFNSQKETLEESRRIELQLHFLRSGEEKKPTHSVPPGNFGYCAIGA